MGLAFLCARISGTVTRLVSTATDMGSPFRRCSITGSAPEDERADVHAGSAFGYGGGTGYGAEMTSISGIMKLGEADATRRDIARRFQMTGQAGYFLLLGLVLLGAAVGAIVSHGPGMAIGVAA